MDFVLKDDEFCIRYDEFHESFIDNWWIVHWKMMDLAFKMMSCVLKNDELCID